MGSMKYILLATTAAALVACAAETDAPASSEEAADAAAPAETASVPVVEATASGPDLEKLDAVLAAQTDETKLRYQYRHPGETIAFFGLEPGMTVVDTLPGGPGWYASILSPYLGAEGTLVGADFAHDMWSMFGSVDADWLEARKTWEADYVSSVTELGGEDGAKVGAITLGSVSSDLDGSADAFLMIRAVHHLNRLEDEGGYFTSALQEASRVLKSGGTLGVVQHRSPEDLPDEWAEGDNGYVKQSQVIAFVEAAGFEFVEASEINANPKDVPTTDDVVWRLPPSLGTSRDDEELRAKMTEIGESDRMTLRFRKP